MFIIAPQFGCGEESIVHQEIEGFWANVRKKLVGRYNYRNKTRERWLGKRPLRIHVRRDENVFSVPF